MPITPLPSSVYTDIASGGPTVVLPAGRWLITEAASGLFVERSNVLVDGRGCTLVPEGANNLGVTLPFGIQSPHDSFAGTVWDARRHGTGVISASTNTISMDTANRAGLSVGDTVWIRFGVQVGDPNEPEFSRFFQIIAINGDVLMLSREVGEAVPTYADYPTFTALVHPTQQNKIGPWATVTANGSAGRGLGADHDVYGFAAHGPVENVTVDGLTIEWLPDGRAYGSADLYAAWVRDCAYNNCNIINPTGTATHLIGCERAVIDHLTVTGVGRTRLNSVDGADYPAIIATMWGGDSCRLRHLNVQCNNFALFGYESGVRNQINEDIRAIASDVQSLAIGSFNVGTSCTNIDLYLDLPQSTNCLQIVPSQNAHFNNFNFPRGLFPDYLDLQLNNSGTFTVGGRIFGPLASIDVEVIINGTTTLVAADTLPAAMYKSAQMVLPSRDNISFILASGAVDIFAANPGALTLPLNHQYWKIVEPGTLAQYFTRLTLLIAQVMPQPLTFRFQAECYPEQEVIVPPDAVVPPRRLGLKPAGGPHRLGTLPPGYPLVIGRLPPGGRINLGALPNG